MVKTIQKITLILAFTLMAAGANTEHGDTGGSNSKQTVDNSKMTHQKTVNKNETTAGQEKALKPQTICPVMGGEINKNYYIDYKEKRIYVCCPACIKEVKKNPEKYIKKLETLGQSVETISQTTQPGQTGTDKK